MRSSNVFVRFLLVILLFIVLLFLLLFYNRTNNYDYDNQQNYNNNEFNNESNLFNIKMNYSHFVKLVSDGSLYDASGNIVGVLYKDAEILLDNDYVISNEFFKLYDCDYYVRYDSVIKISSLKEFGKNEYSTYKNYIVYDSIITDDDYDIYVDNIKYYSLTGSSKYDILINDDDKYGVEFNGRLVYINKDDVRNVLEKNRDSDILNGLPVLNYHYTVNREALELVECTSSICMEDVQVEEEIKYLYDNGYYSMTMRDVYLFLTGKVKFPKKSVAITIDDGWYVSRMISILEKYKMNGTLFLIGSLANPTDYQSSYLEIHSHSWNMHTPGICDGTHGGAMLCWDRNKILDDLEKSRESLNNSDVFCFPFYEYNNRAIRILKEAGFKMGFIGGDRKAYVGDDLFKIHRYVLVNYTDMNTFIGYVSNT